MNRYSVEIERTVDSLAYCLTKLNENADMNKWKMSINATRIDNGVYFNFDFDRKEFEICNNPYAPDTYYLDDIIDMINEDKI